MAWFFNKSFSLSTSLLLLESRFGERKGMVEEGKMWRERKEVAGGWEIDRTVAIRFAQSSFPEAFSRIR